MSLPCWTTANTFKALKVLTITYMKSAYVMYLLHIRVNGFSPLLIAQACYAHTWPISTTKHSKLVRNAYRRGSKYPPLRVFDVHSQEILVSRLRIIWLKTHLHFWRHHIATCVTALTLKVQPSHTPPYTASCSHRCRDGIINGSAALRQLLTCENVLCHVMSLKV